VHVVRHEHPGVAGRGDLLEDPPEALQERVAIPIVPEEPPALDPPRIMMCWRAPGASMRA
jgi:hypothetical protein